MGKIQSLRDLEERDLNVLDYTVIRTRKELLDYLGPNQHELLSLRSERGLAFSCPFYYKTRGKDLLEPGSKLLKEGYSLLVYPSLDTKGCLVFGAIALMKDAPDYIEYVRGEGMCRELYDHPNKKLLKLSFLPRISDPILRSTYMYLLKKLYGKEKDIIVEWSYYNKPVGKLKENLIIWEVRDAK